jgi:hypothetical protein
MVDIGNFRFTDVGRRFDESYGRVNALRLDRAHQQAGNALRGGDFGAAAGALYGAGDLKSGMAIQGYSDARDAARAKAASDRQSQVLEFTTEMAGRLSAIADQAGDDPDAIVSAFEQHFAPRLMQLGESQEEIAQVRQALAQNARQTLLALGAGAAKELGYDIRNAGEEVLVLDKKTGRLVNRFRGARTVSLPEGGALYELPGTGGLTSDGRHPQAPNLGDIPSALGGSAADLMPHLIAQESRGDGNAVGPMTQWGQAFGSTQMLMGTAEEMARKLGVPWRPDLMRGDTPNALAYQQRLGQAYLQEGLDRYGGDPEKALMYYHGGPDEKIWGPKTRDYAASVLRRAGMSGGGGQEALAGGGEGGPRLIAQRPKTPDPMKELQTENLRGQIAEREAKVDDKQQRVARSQETMKSKALVVVDAADKALASIGRGEAGFVGKSMSDVPGTKAYDVARMLETIKANLGFQELQQMRDNSPTGGALGQVAVQELIALQSTVANLDIGQSEQQLRQNLLKIRDRYKQVVDAINEGSGAGASTGEIRTVRTPEEARALPPGTKFRTPDGRVKVR